MANDDKISVDGVVESIAPGGLFEVMVEAGETEKRVIAKCSGKMRRHNIKIVRHDRVKVDLSPYDLERGIIVRRY